ncbi:MAG: TlpA family protein disulfide reductase [SAR324 cluster bacterium]|nr:TlpA family protein disulfide reductase [SAR324 cluster bacterium]MBL7034329.1 TlpA family protein disulfide reductase [SAR324 cluster bacterium]
MSLPKKNLLQLFLLLCLLVFAVYPVHAKSATLEEEDRKLLKSLRITPATSWIEAQNFSAELADGKSVKLEDYRGRFVMLNFWATWCLPCLKEMPDFEKAYQQMGHDKLIVLAVGMGEDTKKISKFAEKYGFSFPLVADPKMEITKLYGVRNIPVTYLIDPNGVVIGRALGVRDWANPDLLAYINSKFK